MSREKVRVLVTGASGLLGSAVKELLHYSNKYELLCPTREEMDCLDFNSVDAYFKKTEPNIIIHLAATVYGLKGNLDNQMLALINNTKIDNNIFHAISLNRDFISKIFYAGTVAAYNYPYQRLPLKEEFLLDGNPHFGEYGYAMAKRHALAYLNILKRNHGVDFIYGVMTNLYGPNDRFNTENGHVIPSLLLKAHGANESRSPLIVWGRKETTRDFLYSLDAAKIIINLLESSYSGIINIASGKESTMEDLVKEIVKLFPEIPTFSFDSEKPVGIPKRSVDVSKLEQLGFLSGIHSLKDGLKETVDWLYRQSIIRK